MSKEKKGFKISEQYGLVAEKQFFEACLRILDVQELIGKHTEKLGFREDSMTTTLDFQVLRLLARITSELGEFFEEFAKEAPEKVQLAEELADIIITTLDLGDYLQIDVGNSVLLKFTKELDRKRRHGKRL